MKMGPIGGTVYFKLGGRQYQLGGSFKFKPNSVVREGKTGLSGPVGYTEKPVLQEVTAELSYTADVDFALLNQVKDETLTFELANGHAYVMRNCFQVGEVEVDGGEGNASVTFQGVMERSN